MSDTIVFLRNTRFTSWLRLRIPCLRKARFLLNPPPPVALNRFAAPLCVFIFMADLFSFFRWSKNHVH
uniref:Uncharacterized protein n=1 Tax=uncultured delta proteobacterium HF0200_39N20 TaxID=710833 RepID=E0XUW3_9DELT|nr:hypothetical protein [uncultured delta proteobacterium HF0200_39N20]